MKKVIIAYPDGSELNLDLNSEEFPKFIDWVENKKGNSFYKVSISNVIHYLYNQNFKYIKVVGDIDDSSQFDETEQIEQAYEDLYYDAVDYC